MRAPLYWNVPYGQYFMGNPAVNGVILGILLAGIFYIFRQVLQLNPEVAWIERFRRSPEAPHSGRNAAPRRADGDDARRPANGGKVRLSATAMRTLLDGVGTGLKKAARPTATSSGCSSSSGCSARFTTSSRRCSR